MRKEVVDDHAHEFFFLSDVRIKRLRKLFELLVNEVRNIAYACRWEGEVLR